MKTGYCEMNRIKYGEPVRRTRPTEGQGEAAKKNQIERAAAMPRSLNGEFDPGSG